ncbi:MAG: LysR family transcriptional regulator [Candidatus Competibacter sp.]
MRDRNEALAWPGLMPLGQLQDRPVLGQRQMALLRQIAVTGSITQAAKAVKLSYKAAWDAVNAMNNMAEQPLVTSATGGKQGGGSRLTDYGLRQIQLYDVGGRGIPAILGPVGRKSPRCGRVNELHAEIDDADQRKKSVPGPGDRPERRPDQRRSRGGHRRR